MQSATRDSRRPLRRAGIELIRVSAVKEFPGRTIAKRLKIKQLKTLRRKCVNLSDFRG
jgi:hypothetical protein